MPTLELSLKSSKLGRLWLLSGHGLALGSVWLSAAPLWGRLLTSIGLAASAWVSWRRGGRPKFTAIRYDGERWILIGSGQPLLATLLPSTWCSRFLTLLHFRLEGGRFLAVPIWRDSLSQDDWRRLQVVLRWQVSFQR